MTESNHRTGRSTEMLLRVLEWQTRHATGEALVLCSHMACARHLLDLARSLDLDMKRLAILPPEFADRRGRGRTFKLFFDHTVWQASGPIAGVIDSLSHRSLP